MKKLSNPQQQIYDYILAYSAEHGYPPSVREMCQAVGLKSTATVHAHLKNLELRGLIVRDPSKQRSIQIPAASTHPSGAVPLVGQVAAGQPILATENVEDAFPLPSLLLQGKSPEQVYMLRVEGESMIDAGIRSGDILVVNHDCAWENGDIVVARVGGESATVKRIYRERDRVRLQPENPLFDPIYVSYDNLALDGKVIGLIRTI